jgi:hypothetical protein
MAKPSQDRIVAALPERHGQTYADEIGIERDRRADPAVGEAAIGLSDRAPTR